MSIFADYYWVEDLPKELNFSELLEKNVKKCKKITPHKIKTAVKKEYDLIFLDLNSLTIVPFLRRNDVVIKNVNFTPFIRTILLVCKLKDQFPNAKFIGVVDNGVSRKLKKLCNYKNHRRHSVKENLSLVGKNSNDVYKVNIRWIFDLFAAAKNFYLDLSYGEADFKIGYFLKHLEKGNKYKDIAVFTSDNDYIQLITKADVFLYRKGKYIYFEKNSIECLNEFLGIEFSHPVQYLYYKALLGDKADNIPQIVSNRKLKNFFERINSEYDPEDLIKLEDFIKAIYEDKHLIKSNAIDSVINQFKINLYAVNMFNDDVFESNEKIMLNSSLEKMEEFFESHSNKKIEQLLSKFSFYFGQNLKNVIKCFSNEK